jgi:hypothetical protein
MGWVSVKDSLPVIPKGRYGIQVLVCTYDGVYDEDMEQGDTIPFSRGKGLDVRMISFHYPQGKKVPIEEQTAGFYMLEHGYDSWVECVHEPVVCWMYIPNTPEYEAHWDVEENRLIFEDIIKGDN